MFNGQAAGERFHGIFAVAIVILRPGGIKP